MELGIGTETTIPNFIFVSSPSKNPLFARVSAFGTFGFTPFLRHFAMEWHRLLCRYPVFLKLLHSLIHSFVRHVNVPIHGGLDAGVTQQFLQHLRLHSAFDGTGRIGVTQRVHTKTFDPCFVAELVQMGIIRAVLRRLACSPRQWFESSNQTKHPPSCSQEQLWNRISPGTENLLASSLPPEVF